MVAPKHVRRSEEIKRLTKQLEELRAAREKLSDHEPNIPSAEARAPPTAIPATPSVQGSALGKHGEGSRFLSVSQMETDGFFPRVLPVAGRLPSLTAAQLEATVRVQTSGSVGAGNVYVTTLPNGHSGQVVALPGIEVIAEAVDPVVVIASVDEVSAVAMPVREGGDVLLIVDRVVGEFDAMKFYAWDEGGVVKVGWRKEGGRVIGKVVYGVIEVREELRKKRSCWEEENETYS